MKYRQYKKSSINICLSINIHFIQSGGTHMLHKSYQCLFCLSFLLTVMGCSSNTSLKEDEITPFEQGTYTTDAVMISDDGYYLATDDYIVFYEYGSNEGINITSIIYADDEPIDPEGYTYKKYQDSICTILGMYYFDDSLIYLTEYLNVNGESWYSLMQMSSDGTTRKELLKLDYVPCFCNNGSLMIQKNRIFIVEEGAESTDETFTFDTEHTIHMYDLNMKELGTFTVEGSVQLYASGDRVYFFETRNNQVKYIDLNDDQLHEFNYNETDMMCFVNGDHYTSYTTIPNYEENTFTITSQYKNLETGETELSFENELLYGFDEKYLYTSLVDGSNQVYKIYNKDGSLNKEIIPSTLLEGNDNDFNPILGIVNGMIVSQSCYLENDLADTMNYFTCDIENGTCSYLK